MYLHELTASCAGPQGQGSPSLAESSIDGLGTSGGLCARKAGQGGQEVSIYPGGHTSLQLLFYQPEQLIAFNSKLSSKCFRS